MSICHQHRDRYEQLAAELSGFENGEELMDFVLEHTAKELSARNDSAFEDDLNEEVVEERLQDLGYME
ncbi:hypothetical protein HAL_24320 [Haladaptatus sp. T7]|nr:hypothetical protein HAL_24320 [Haladaptatus sp. T7]